MAKYIVIEDFESSWTRPTDNTPQVAVFPKGSTIFAVPSKFDGALVTRPDGSMPLGKLGEILVKVVEPKIKMIEESTANTGKKDYMKWIYLGGAGILLWWYLTKDNKKKEI